MKNNFIFGDRRHEASRWTDWWVARRSRGIAKLRPRVALTIPEPPSPHHYLAMPPPGLSSCLCLCRFLESTTSCHWSRLVSKLYLLEELYPSYCFPKWLFIFQFDISDLDACLTCHIERLCPSLLRREASRLRIYFITNTAKSEKAFLLTLTPSPQTSTHLADRTRSYLQYTCKL